MHELKGKTFKKRMKEQSKRNHKKKASKRSEREENKKRDLVIFTFIIAEGNLQ